MDPTLTPTQPCLGPSSSLVLRFSSATHAASSNSPRSTETITGLSWRTSSSSTETTTELVTAPATTSSDPVCHPATMQRLKRKHYSRYCC
ncbi:hypothetical protein LOK49_LG03G03651 [Camellia lanceoleosa]|uniref:Uncharacterized protein n=1 Tax=Camellia lanceoleosa TaxID=1840588 RepID=A0ACC0IA47_9ERIC|nr:hypothetical protein LOK49_LG03G03651 [Camellia lanceoleosa]